MSSVCAHKAFHFLSSHSGAGGRGQGGVLAGCAIVYVISINFANAIKRLIQISFCCAIPKVF